MGYKEFELKATKGDLELNPSKSPALGLLKQESRIRSYKLSELLESARLEVTKQELLVLTKGSHASTIHRRAYTDYVGIKSLMMKAR